MKISHDGTTVSFKTEAEEQFLAEKSGAKSNIVRILDAPETYRIRHAPPAKIIIQHDQEIFLRTLTNICEVGDMLGKVIVIFSWTHENYHHAIHDEKGLDPKAYTMSLDEEAKQYKDEEISRELLVSLNNLRGELPLNKLIRKMIDCYLTAPPQHTRPTFEDYNVAKTMRCPVCQGDLMNIRTGEFVKCAICRTLFRLDLEEKTAPAAEEKEEDKKLALIGISKGMRNILVRLTYDRSMDTVIRELYQIYLDKRAEEVGPLHD